MRTTAGTCNFVFVATLVVGWGMATGGAPAQVFPKSDPPSPYQPANVNALHVQVLETDPHPQHRLDAALTLGRNGDSQVVPALARAAAFDADREVRIASGDAIARIRRRTQQDWVRPVAPDRPGGGYHTRLVTNWYQLYLHRQPDPDGLTQWVNTLRKGGRPEEVQATILGSDEYYRRHGANPARWVANLYADVLARSPTPTEMQSWVNQLRRNRSRDQVALEFLTASKAELTTRDAPPP